MGERAISCVEGRAAGNGQPADPSRILKAVEQRYSKERRRRAEYKTQHADQADLQLPHSECGLKGALLLGRGRRRPVFDHRPERVPSTACRAAAKARLAIAPADARRDQTAAPPVS